MAVPSKVSKWKDTEAVTHGTGNLTESPDSEGTAGRRGQAAQAVVAWCGRGWARYRHLPQSLRCLLSRFKSTLLTRKKIIKEKNKGKKKKSPVPLLS